MSQEIIKNAGIYYSIINGSFRRKVPEGTQGAVAREYETKDGGKAVKHELIVDGLTGHIQEMGIFDGDFGRNLQIKLDANSYGVMPTIQLSVENNYGEDVLKKLPGVDFSKEVTFKPYAFTSEQTGKEIRGVSIYQEEAKIENFFFHKETKQAMHGMPGIPDGAKDTFSKDDWKIHFLGVRKFLIDYFTGNVMPKFEAVQASIQEKVEQAPQAAKMPIESIDPADMPDFDSPAATMPASELDPDDIPF